MSYDNNWHVPGQPNDPPPPEAPRKTHPVVWILGGLLVLIVLCLVGVIVAIANGDPVDDDKAAVKAPAVAPTPPRTIPTPGVKPTPDIPPPAATPAPKPTPKTPVIDGDDIVHVGEDVPAGTYRAVEPVDGGLFSCYWKKSRDAEGSNIIDNALPTGGRPQVTLKKGQWFESRGCPDWKRK